MTQPTMQSGLSRLDRIETVLDRVLSWLAIAILVVMTALVIAAVAARYVFQAPLVYSYDLSTLLFAWVVFLGLFSAERDGAHISLDVLGNVPDGIFRRALMVLKQLILIALAAFMTWIGYRLILRTGMQIPSMRISVRWLYASLPAGFAGLTLIYLLRLPGIVAGRER